MATTNSPNMFMPIPGVGSEQGPNYSLDINASLYLIDSHDHSLGRGVQITPAGININTDFSLNSNDLTDVGGIGFTALGSNPTTLQFLYVSPGVETPVTEDLWFNDGNGNQVQITNNGLVNATIASLPGESYAAGTFFWKQGAGSTTPANFDIGSITIRPNVAATVFGVRLQPPAGITTQYDIALPLLPITKSFMTIDASGTIEAQNAYSKGITAANIADNTITTNQISLTANITGTQLLNNTVGLTQLATTVLQWNTATFTITTPAFNVRVATTANGTIGTAFANGQTVDGVVIATNDIILIKNQTTATEDGVYVVQASGTPVRQTSYDTFTELNYAGVHVTTGTANTGTDWFQNNILTSLLDNQSWSQSSTQAWTVPANVNQIYTLGIGGGGGGGGSGGSTGGGGGGGGGGALGLTTTRVTPGDIIAITVGFKGAGGAASTVGGNGQASNLIGTGVSITYSGGGGGGFGGNAASIINSGPGGDSVGSGGPGIVSNNVTGGGAGGGGGGSTGNGGTGVASTTAAGTAATPTQGAQGGGGAGGKNNSTGTAGGGSFYATTRAAAGTGSGSGGGGGSGLAVGGAGGSSAVGTAASTADSGAGGGGGGSGGTTARAGGNGASGKVIIYWLGAP